MQSVIVVVQPNVYYSLFLNEYDGNPVDEQFYILF